MKEKVVYIVSFLLAFIIVTGLIIYLNSTFKNIFTFDFSSAETRVDEIIQRENPVAASTLPAADTTNQNIALQDTVKPVQDTTHINSTSITLSDTNAVRKITKKISEEIKPLDTKQAVSQEDPAKKAITAKSIARKDSTYNAWVKTTVKLYESMETRKAAKIILGYSDNIARDILMNMKKKKAAEILAEFKPEIATRIISVVQ